VGDILMNKRILISIPIVLIFTLVFTFYIKNTIITSTFLQCRVSYLEIYTFKEKKTISNYKEIKKIINYIDSIEYISENNQKMLLGVNAFSIKIVRKNNIKYSNEFLVFYPKYIHYFCYNNFPNYLIDEWYTCNNNIFNTIKDFNDKAK
jgi:hypothetical protein